MRVFVCTDHAGVWPVGVCSIVVADEENQAYELLRRELDRRDLKRMPFTLREIDTTVARAQVLLDGDY